MSIVLGLSFGYHDAAAAIVKDGQIIAAASEERFSRKKNDAAFPKEAIKFCMEKVGVEKLDSVVFYENPYLKMQRQITFAVQSMDEEYLSMCVDSLGNEFDAIGVIAKYFSIDRAEVLYYEHHLSHAASAFFASGYSSAAVLVMDGVGEYDTISIYKGERKSLKKLWSVPLPFSIGLLYTAFTYFLGFEINEGEYKVMGMAGYGRPIYKDKIYSCLKVDFDKDIYEIDVDMFEFSTPVETHIKPRFYDIFGQRRDPKAVFSIDNTPENEKNIYYADLAASLQAVTEDLIIGFAKKAIHLCGGDTLCIAGGVGLNSAANGRMRKELGLKGYYIQPAAGDAGASLGAALMLAAELDELPADKEVMQYDIGKKYGRAEIEQVLFDFMIESDEFELIEDEALYVDRLAGLILGGSIIGWLWGGFEFGPRSLGRRSILANPTYPNMKDIVNAKIKYRELFRPFAPSILEEKAHEWFELSQGLDANAPERFMLAITPVREEKKAIIPAVTHIDGTARIHLVASDGSLYRKLLESMQTKGGIPMLLNTSFNLKGEPIVSSPADAFRTFIQCGIDVLAMYPYLVLKKW